MSSNASINERATAGDVWRDFGSSLQQFVGRRVQNPDDVDEIVQEIFLKLHANIDEIDEPVGWIFRVARNAIIDFYRSAQRRLEVPTAPSATVELLPAMEDMADGEDVWEEFRGCVDPLLRGLSSTDRAAVSLVDLQGRSQAEVADELGISVSGAKSRVQRARRKMLRALEECCVIQFDARGHPLGMEPRPDGTSI